MIEAKSIISKPIAALRSIIGASPAFMKWSGVDDAQAAAAAVYLVEAPRVRPARFAIVDFGDMLREKIYVSPGKAFEHGKGNTLLAYFRAEITDETNDDAIFEFTNDLGLIWEDIEKDAGDYAKRTLAITSIEMTVRPTRIVHEKQQRVGDYVEAVLSIIYSRQP